MYMIEWIFYLNRCAIFTCFKSFCPSNAPGSHLLVLQVSKANSKATRAGSTSILVGETSMPNCAFETWHIYVASFWNTAQLSGEIRVFTLPFREAGNAMPNLGLLGSRWSWTIDEHWSKLIKQLKINQITMPGPGHLLHQAQARKSAACDNLEHYCS